MTTDMPRKNVYINQSTADMLEIHAKTFNLSESEIVRRALNLYLLIAPYGAYKAAEKFAKEKDVGVEAVILATLSRQVPDKYYENNEE